MYLLLLLFSLLPTGIGVVFLHGFGENIGLLAEILSDTRLHPRLTMNVITPDDLYSAG
jgi:hypothetical protein